MVPTGALLGSGGSMSIGTLHDSHMNTPGSLQYSPSSENGGILKKNNWNIDYTDRQDINTFFEIWK